MKTFALFAVAGLLGLAAGCETTRPVMLPHTGDPVQDGQAAIAQGPARDKVLWQYRTAAAAMRRGQYDVAKSLLDDALLTTGSVINHDKNARKARGYFHEESKKTFIGEPYERVMAYYYRGILYWMDGEPDNARACFRSAELEDSDTQNKEYSADYVLLDYLDGLATAKLAGDGSDALKRARAEAKMEPPPDYDPQANVLCFIEYGSGPLKYATGQYREELRFRPGPFSPVRLASIQVAGQTIRARPFDDLYFQATTRGGRVMDHILANKAVFKRSTDVAGDAALVSGLILSQDRHTEDVGIGLAAAGLLSKIVSAATTPAADVRMWENLPQYLSFSAVKLPPGQYAAIVEFEDVGGRAVAGLTKNLTIDVKAGKDTVVFVSDRK